MPEIHHVTFECRGCKQDVTVVGVNCDKCSTRAGITIAEWELVRAAVSDNAVAMEIVDRALKGAQP